MMLKVKKWQLLRSLVLVFLAIWVSGSPLAYAKIGSEDLYRFAENNILYYDPCGETESVTTVSGLTLSGEDPGTRLRQEPAMHGHWDGSCNELSRAEMVAFVEEQFPYAQTVAAEKQLPWEGMLAQAGLESGWGKHKSCEYNLLGMKPRSGRGACSNGYAIFESYEDMWEGYSEEYVSTRRAQGLFSQDPYSYLEFIENTAHLGGFAYAEDSSYVNKVSRLVCGIQKWAEANGIKTSAVTYANWESGNFVDNIDNYNSGGSTMVSTATNVDNLSSSDTGEQTGVKWNDGWITNGLEGYKKIDGNNLSMRLDSSAGQKYGTSSGKPNKILLHTTDGGSRSTIPKNGDEVVSMFGGGERGFLPLSHFVINMWDKKVVQLLSINKTAGAISEHDDLAGVQIEIVGMSAASEKDRDTYLPDAKNTNDEDWDYLAKLLVAISQETGIPLTQNVDWTKTSTLELSAFKNYSGVLGHMHATDNGHKGDPGDIWKFIEPAIERVKGTGQNSLDDTAAITGSTGSKVSDGCPESQTQTTVDTSDDWSSKIVEYAFKYAWPYQESDGVDKAGKCELANGTLVAYDGKYTDSICRNNAKEVYKQDSVGPNDLTACNYYVATVVRKSGADPDYETGPTGSQLDYLRKEAQKADGKWERVENSEVKAGDVGVKSGHTYIYVGQEGGKWGVLAQASHYDTVPVVGPSSSKGPREGFEHYRRKSNGASGTCNFNSINGEGCTFYCQGGSALVGREDWADLNYGNCGAKGTYSWSGCGPTALAMVISNLSGKKVLPTEIGDKAVAMGARMCGSGTDGSRLVDVVRDYGLQYEKIGFSEAAINAALDAGKVVYLSGRGGAPFSSSGHYIAIRGKTSDGNWLLFNSAGGCNKGEYSSSKKPYSPSTILSQSLNKGPYAIYK